MSGKRVLTVASIVVGSAFLSACGSDQISVSLTQNINTAVSSTPGVEESAITVDYSNRLTGPHVTVEGVITYDPDYGSNYDDEYFKNLKTIAVLVRDIGGIERGKITVTGDTADGSIIPGSLDSSDSESISLKDMLAK